MLFEFKNWWRRAHFDRAVIRVLETRPISLNKSSLRIVSSVSHEDLLMYLVAIKSFCRFITHGEIVVLNDGSLSEKDKKVLQEHVHPVSIMQLDQIPYRHGTKGVRWGILLAIADMLDDHYVVHIDSDTLTIDNPSEVNQCIESNRSFTLGTNDGREIASVKNCSDFVRNSPSNHVQIVAEKHLEQLPFSENLKYVRGNSGLTGYARNSFNRDSLEAFYHQMELLVGAKIKDRGSFQFSSNYVVANGINPMVLPLDRYPCITPQIPLVQDQAVFMHFIGRYRFDRGLYKNKVLQALRFLYG